MAEFKYRFSFALEYSLGHITHAQNLKRMLQGRSDIVPSYVDLPYDGMTGAWAKLPGVRSNWTLRASLGAWLGLRGQARHLAGALFHTQVTSLFSAGIMRRVPSVISLDATPVQYDALGAFYGHTPSGNARLEDVKKRLNQRAFGASRHLVTWSQWTKDSLVADYGVPAQKVTVIPPGVDQTLFLPDPAARPGDGVTRLLFVGGSFARKGGELLLRWARETSVAAPWELHLVTRDPVPDTAHVFVHRDVDNNGSELVGLYQGSDVFVLPTLADCFPLVSMEAMSCGLPVVTSRMGGIPEIVREGETGFLMEPGDYSSLAQRLDRLVADASLRQALGQAALEQAREKFDCRVNMGRILEIMTTGNSAGYSEGVFAVSRHK